MSTKNNSIEWLNVEQASKYLGVTKSTVYHYTHRKLISYRRMNGRRIIFLKQDLDNFLLNSPYYASQSELQQQAQNL